MTEILEEIRSRGFWKVVIRPATFIENRIEYLPDLYNILLKTSVELRGLGFPILGSHTTVKQHQDWIEQQYDWEWYVELWRFYQSGQFVDLKGVEGEWRDKSVLFPAKVDWASGRFLVIEDVVDQFTEVFELAARMAFTAAGDDRMHLEISVHGIKGRRLTARDSFDGGFHFTTSKPIEVDELSFKFDLSKFELVASPRELALKPAVKLLSYFDWNIGINLLRDIQTELFRPYPATAR